MVHSYLFVSFALCFGLVGNFLLCLCLDGLLIALLHYVVFHWSLLCFVAFVVSYVVLVWLWLLEGLFLLTAFCCCFCC